jgi:hypothetical protein
VPGSHREADTAVGPANSPCAAGAGRGSGGGGRHAPPTTDESPVPVSVTGVYQDLALSEWCVIRPERLAKFLERRISGPASRRCVYFPGVARAAQRSSIMIRSEPASVSFLKRMVLRSGDTARPSQIAPSILPAGGSNCSRIQRTRTESTPRRSWRLPAVYADSPKIIESGVGPSARTGVSTACCCCTFCNAIFATPRWRSRAFRLAQRLRRSLNALQAVEEQFDTQPYF